MINSRLPSTPATTTTWLLRAALSTSTAALRRLFRLSTLMAVFIWQTKTRRYVSGTFPNYKLMNVDILYILCYTKALQNVLIDDVIKYVKWFILSF